MKTKIFVILHPNKGMKETHMVKYPDKEEAQKISKNKWFELHDKPDTICLQPLYDES